MSIQAMTQCWDPTFPVQCEGLSGPVIRLTALAIADVVNDAHGNRFYMAVPNLARKAGTSATSVRLVLRHLERAGVLKVLDEEIGKTGKPTRFQWTWTPTDSVAPLVSTPTDSVAPPQRDSAVSAPTPTDVRCPPQRTSVADTQLIPSTQNPSSQTQASDADICFDAFWQMYPRKEAKPVARRAFDKAMRKATLSAIVDGLQLWITHWQARNEPEFIPHPTTWLNQERWNDAPPPLGVPKRTRNAGFDDLLEARGLPVRPRVGLNPAGRALRAIGAGDE